MPFDIFLNHIFGNVSSTPGSIACSPEMLTPVTFVQLGIFILEQP